MEKQGTHTVRTGVIVACCIVAAILCRNIGMEAPGFILRLLRSFIYIGLFTGFCGIFGGGFCSFPQGQFSAFRLSRLFL